MVCGAWSKWLVTWLSLVNLSQGVASLTWLQNRTRLVKVIRLLSNSAPCQEYQLQFRVLLRVPGRGSDDATVPSCGDQNYPSSVKLG
ncbi:hypothetical protein H6G17_19765 [Chroococcidiopsis sp. FACHB-1243]|uniref:hypothetical protein n=1 Tax=Chroococcidiopsis sp. [FACHB-1243] TaxID=2692781 RepID=UPI00177D7C2C|nr:hypothetical protein [Chroococcidiopsis sp. [FACHB-1243]]MBD2307709.1 hypothetical protein [Chroococcidiopsis sp. [FACHB-1243]]